MKNRKNVRNIAILGGIAVLVFGIVFGIISLTQNAGKDQSTISEESAVNTMNRLYNRIRINTLDPVKGQVDLEEDDLKDTLPDIEKSPVMVDSNTADFIEIFSSPEKAGSGTDSWLIEVAKHFNLTGTQIDGKTVSVKIRNVASGLAMDYISSGKYVPEAYSPSNELWGEMLTAKGVKISLVEKSLVGNVAGIVLSKAKQAEVVNKYGSVSVKTIAEAVANNELSMGYTNPFASSAGLNYLISTLYAFDPQNPLGSTAVSAFEKFQANIPYVAYTTMQMRESAKSGTLDGFILEYQSYVNTPDIKANYEFTPFGVRHDNPIYEVGELTDLEKKIIKEFVKYCKDSMNQQRGEGYGFGGLSDYVSEMAPFKGDLTIQAQKLWKEKKNAGVDIAAVFVADVSGSMEGDSLKKLQESLQKGSKYIGKDNSIGLVTFSNDVNICLPIAKFDINQRSLFAGAVENMKASGSTAMFDGITVASKMLMDEKAKNPNLKLMLFVLSDGETNTGSNLKDIQGMVKGLQIPIYTIGYNANIDALQAVSNINEAASINADTDDVVYKLGSLFNAQM